MTPSADARVSLRVRRSGLTIRLTSQTVPPPMDTVTLSSKGQLVIPKAVRQRAQVAAGSRFSVHYVDGEIRLRPVARAPASTVEEVAGCLARPARKRLSDAQAQAAIKARLKAQHAP